MSLHQQLAKTLLSLAAISSVEQKHFTTVYFMLGSNNLEESMLNDTLSTFRKDSQFAISPAQGIILIDGWLQALQGDPNLDQLTGQLNELRTALQAAQPDDQYIKGLLISLADKAQAVAEEPSSEGTWTGGLVSLSKILRNLGNK